MCVAVCLCVLVSRMCLWYVCVCVTNAFVSRVFICVSCFCARVKCVGVCSCHVCVCHVFVSLWLYDCDIYMCVRVCLCHMCMGLCGWDTHVCLTWVFVFVVGECTLIMSDCITCSVASNCRIFSECWVVWLNPILGEYVDRTKREWMRRVALRVNYTRFTGTNENISRVCSSICVRFIWCIAAGKACWFSNCTNSRSLWSLVRVIVNMTKWNKRNRPVAWHTDERVQKVKLPPFVAKRVCEDVINAYVVIKKKDRGRCDFVVCVYVELALEVLGGWMGLRIENVFFHERKINKKKFSNECSHKV